MCAWTRSLKPSAACMKSTAWHLFKSVEHYRQPSAYMFAGSTSVSVSIKEPKRMTTLRKIAPGHETPDSLLAQPEHFFSYTTLPIATCGTYRPSWILEHMLIDSWQAQAQLSVHRCASASSRILSNFRGTPELRCQVRKKLYPKQQPYQLQLSTQRA